MPFDSNLEGVQPKVRELFEEVLNRLESAEARLDELEDD